MHIADLFHWIQATGWATALRESEYAYPVIMSLHLTAIALFGGMILMTNLRLLGFVMRANPAADVIRQLRPWKWAGFALMVTCGILLASSKADQYYPNPYFRMKMTLLAMVGVNAIVFRRISKPKLAACISLALWLGILTMGRWIAYYEPPKGAATQRLNRVLTASVSAATQM